MNHHKVKIVLTLVAVTVLGLCFAYLRNLYIAMGNEEEWNVLQTAASRYRLSADKSTILFTSLNGYEVIGIRVASEPPTSEPSNYPRVWVLAAPKFRVMVKVIPVEIDYAITPADLSLILLKVPSVSAATQVELRKHIRE